MSCHRCPTLSYFHYQLHGLIMKAFMCAVPGYSGPRDRLWQVVVSGTCESNILRRNDSRIGNGGYHLDMNLDSANSRMTPLGL